MFFNPPSTPRSRQEILVDMTKLQTFLVFAVAKQIESFTSEVQSSGSGDYVNAVTNKLGEAKDHIGFAIRALREAYECLKGEQERRQGGGNY